MHNKNIKHVLKTHKIDNDPDVNIYRYVFNIETLKSPFSMAGVIFNNMGKLKRVSN